MQDTKTASKTLAAVYVRVSTDKQEKWSPDSQRRVLLEHCARNGWEPVLYGETGSGETIEGRPQMIRLLKDARDRKFNVCLVVELSRLSRDKDLLDLLIIKQTFRDAGVSIATLAQTYDLTRPDDDFTSDLLGLLSKHEKQRMLERVRRGMREAKMKGTYLGEWLPYGWKAEAGRAVHDPVEAEGVRLILSLAKSRSSRNIVKELNVRGIKAKRGGSWTWTSLCNWLKNPALYGKMTYGDLPVEIPPYCTEAEFREIRAAAEKRVTCPKYIHTHEYLLTGFLFCGKCGLRIYARTEVKRGGSKFYGYYLCSGKAKRDDRTCDFPRMRQDKLEAAVWEQFQQYLKSPQLIYDALSIAYEEQDMNRAQKAQEEAQVARRMDDLAREETKLIRAFYGDRAGLDKESFEAAVGEVRKEKAILAQRMEEVRATTLPTVAEIAALPDLKTACETFSAGIDAWTTPMKREALELLLDRVIVQEDMSLTIRCKISMLKAPASGNLSYPGGPVLRLFDIQTAPFERITRKPPYSSAPSRWTRGKGAA